MTSGSGDSGWGEDFEWTQLPARGPRGGNPEPAAGGLPPTPEEPLQAPPGTETRTDDVRPAPPRRSDPRRTQASRPTRPRAGRRWLAIASIFVLGLATGALAGYLGRGDGRPSNVTTVDVALDQVTVTVTR